MLSDMYVASPMMRYPASRIFYFLAFPNSVPDLVYALQHDNHQDGLENGVEYIFSKDSQNYVHINLC